ncbi:cerato-ulmin [Diaporthe amygdali]|uniref:cerato-ulmin n=1 Tax=Phomopsis amygdali TaxID=1214568 RepID=UPI0022FEB565|nr:cerato-ulmin [Diaporthe amygdali]KAJ0106830.1 cerato-ulmin [Diaporthe amygdali]
MQLSALILSVMASLAMAVPTNTGGGGDGGGGDGGGSSDYDPCTATALINAQAQCCSADVGGIADLTCKTVPETPKSADDFKDICASSGQTAMCCTLSVLGVSLLCATPIGV